jgi:hypothetical protein
MVSFLLSVASGVVTALVLVIARETRRVAKSVTESAAAAVTLTATVATLHQHDAENRERIAALWAHVFPYPSSLWSTANANSQHGYHARNR